TQINFLKSPRYRKIIYVEVLFSPLIILLLTNFVDFKSIFDRFLAITTGISERSNQWTYLNTLDMELIFGNGLGTMSHKALDISEFLINDGGYFKLIAETGIIGFLLFIGILFSTVYRYFT